jgi:hypothetical protein
MGKRERKLSQKAQEAAWKARRKTVVILEDIDFIWDEQELTEIKEMWDRGISIHSMTKAVGRKDPDEVLMTIIHLARKNKIKRRPDGPYGIKLEEENEED